MISRGLESSVPTLTRDNKVEHFAENLSFPNWIHTHIHIHTHTPTLIGNEKVQLQLRAKSVAYDRQSQMIDYAMSFLSL